MTATHATDGRIRWYAGLPVPVRAALALIALIVVSASAVSFAESYRGLWLWASHHAVSGLWAAVWPLQVDAFIAVGELALYSAIAMRQPKWTRMAAWTVTLSGLAVSVAGNVGHVPGHAWQSRISAAVPPIAAAFALAVGLGIFKRGVEAAHSASEDPATFGQCPHDVPSTAEEAVVQAFLHERDCEKAPPANRDLAARFGIHRDKVAKLLAPHKAEAANVQHGNADLAGSPNGHKPQEATAGTIPPDGLTAGT